MNQKSFLKWAGGKSKNAKQLVELAPPFTGRYFEPFMGSAAVFFELSPRGASLSDENLELVICFKQIASEPEKVMALLDEMPNNRDFYNEIRAQEVDELTNNERAARVIYLNKTGFRGLWRVNKKGKFNVPYGEYERPYYNSRTLLNASKALQGVDISHRDFSESLKKTKKEDWVYLDPPYIPVGQYSDFKRYTSGQFRKEDQERLAEAMHEASERGVYITMTNSDTSLTRKMFRGFNMFSMTTRRDINLEADKRTSSDLIFTNYEI